MLQTLQQLAVEATTSSANTAITGAIACVIFSHLDVLRGAPSKRMWRKWIPTIPWHHQSLIPASQSLKGDVDYLLLLQPDDNHIHLLWLKELLLFDTTLAAVIASLIICSVSLKNLVQNENDNGSKSWRWITSIWSSSKKEHVEITHTRKCLQMMQYQRSKLPTVNSLLTLSEELYQSSLLASYAGAVSCLSVASDVPSFSEIAVISSLSIAATVGFTVDVNYWMTYTPNVEMRDRWMIGVVTIPSYEHFNYPDRCLCLKHGVELTNTRINSFLQENVEPYHYPEDTSTDMVLRVADGAAMIASAVAPHFQRWNTALRIIGQISLFKQLAPYMLGYIALSSDVGEALADLASLMSLSQSGPQSTTQLIIGLYYLLVYRRGERGNHPTSALSDHSESSPGVVKEDASESDLYPIRKYACLAKFVYQETAADVQRLAVQQGFTLLVYEPLVNARHPPYCFFQDDNSKEILITIRGTKHLSDILIDICAKPAILKTPKNSYKVHRGMLRSALWIAVKIWHSVLVLVSKGFRFKVVGHSLGAGIGILLTTILREFDIIPELECVGFAMPSCCERSLAEKAESYCISAVNGDDLVPRVRSTSLHNLMTAVADPVLQDRSEKDLSGDTSAVLGRLATVWAPRVRKKSTNPKEPKEVKSPVIVDKDVHKGDYPHLRFGIKEEESFGVTVVFERQDYGLEELLISVKPSAPLSVVRAQAAAAAGMLAAADANLFIENKLISPTDVEKRTDTFFSKHLTHSCRLHVTRKIGGCSASELLILQFANPGESPESIGLLQLNFKESTVKAIVAALAAKSGRTNPTSIEVWSISGNNQQRIPAGTSGEGWNQSLHSLGLKSGDILLGRDSWGARLLNQQSNELLPNTSNVNTYPSSQSPTSASAERQKLLDADLIEFWPPGKIIHLYFVCGIAKATLLRPWARVLERIELSSKMGDDHRMDSMMRSLRSLSSCRKQSLAVPEWEPFGAAMQCCCCLTNFAWESTSSTAASQLRSRAHCHHCGKVVCTECRQNTLSSAASPSPTPICDTCFFSLA
eukprot:TRINITY_DN14962_c0_g1_i1.p1 TRINITY_DN14962_c0_g1~~TRINITY_DN14962_c0_g1_i1.p1  ORF type:complete len:1181 (+),score=202.28 TRINITY_DN14962_c0_g1_i1:421-3543(+)